MSNFPTKKSEKKPSTLLEVITAGAAVKTAIDVGDVKSELRELKRIEQDRAWAEERDRKEARKERNRLAREQQRHQEHVEEDLRRRAEQEDQSFSKVEEDRVLHEIEEIVRLNLGIKQEHYEAVKSLARKNQVPREEAAEKFRTDVISRGLGMLLRSEFCPPEQRYEKVIETCPRFPKDESFVESYLLVCLESDLNLTQAYEVFTADQDEQEQRKIRAKGREERDKKMIELRLGTDAAILESIRRQISKFSEIEKQLGESAKMKRRASQKWQILGLGSVLVATFVSVCLLFREEGWKAGVTFGALVGLIFTWGIYELLKTTGLIFPRYYEESWFKGVNSKVLRRALSVSSMDISNLRMRAPGGNTSEADLDRLVKSLADATDAGFVFAVKYLLPVPEISGQLHHHVLLRNAHLFSKDRALYLLSSAPAVLTSLECFVAQKNSREFLVQLKKWQDDLLATEFLDLLLDELEDEASDNQKLERLFHQVSTFYSVAVAEELFWTYGYATSGFTRPASGN